MSTVYFIILIAFMTAHIAAFGILLIGKLGIRNEIIMRAPRLISKLFDCDFCLSFWFSFILAIIFAIIFNAFILLLVPIISTPITRILI